MMDVPPQEPGWLNRLRRYGEKLSAFLAEADRQSALRQERKRLQAMEKIKRRSGLNLIFALVCTAMVVVSILLGQRPMAACWCFFALIGFGMFMFGDHLKRRDNR